MDTVNFMVSKNVYIYEYLEFEPRVQFLEGINSIRSRKDGYKLLNESFFDINKNSFISSDDLERSPELSFSPLSEVAIKKYSPNKIVITTDTKGTDEGQHFVLLSEIFFPYGWDINGAENLEIIEVNNLLRGFFVPNGKSEITLEFIPFDLKYSSLITYFSLIIIFCTLPNAGEVITSLFIFGVIFGILKNIINIVFLIIYKFFYIFLSFFLYY